MQFGAIRRFSARGFDLGFAANLFSSARLESRLEPKQYGAGPNDSERTLRKLLRPEAPSTGSPRFATALAPLLLKGNWFYPAGMVFTMLRT